MPLETYSFNNTVLQPLRSVDSYNEEEVIWRSTSQGVEKKVSTVTLDDFKQLNAWFDRDGSYRTVGSDEVLYAISPKAFFKLEVGGSVRSYVACVRFPETRVAHYGYYITDEDYRKQQFGTTLWQAVDNHAKQQGVDSFRLKCVGEPLTTMYTGKAGYSVSDLQVGRKANTGDILECLRSQSVPSAVNTTPSEKLLASCRKFYTSYVPMENSSFIDGWMRKEDTKTVVTVDSVTSQVKAIAIRSRLHDESGDLRYRVGPVIMADATDARSKRSLELAVVSDLSESSTVQYESYTRLFDGVDQREEFGVNILSKGERHETQIEDPHKCLAATWPGIC